MSDFNIVAMHGGHEIKTVYHQGHVVQAVIHQGRLVYYPETVRVDDLFPTYALTPVDAEGQWFEFDFHSIEPLTGNAAAGWTDAGNYAKLEIQQSSDLENWNMGKFLPAPVDPVLEMTEDGLTFWRYRSRCQNAVFYQDTLNDFHLTTARYGKSITGIDLLGATITLDYPFPMPDEGELQAALRDNGHPAATVTIVAKPISVQIFNHTDGAKYLLPATMDGNDVTDVKSQGSTIPLDYPFPMPDDGELQAALRAAGLSGAVVNMYGDEWTINLPDVVCQGSSRPFALFVTPDDPYPAWDFRHDYLGLLSSSEVKGYLDNTRLLSGLSQVEHRRQFARLRITPGNRYTGLPNNPFLLPNP